jgi:hypothetical protein
MNQITKIVPSARNLVICVSQTKKGRKFSRACDTHGRNEKCVHFDKKTERDNLGDPDVDGRIVTKMRKRCEGVDWVHLAQDTDQWRALVDKIMIFHIL